MRPHSTVSTGGSYQALLKSAQTVSWTIVDQYGSPVVGASVAISHAGANAPTVAPAIIVSDSAGKVTYTWTDALGVAASTTLGTDTVAVATVNAVAPTVSTGSVTVTWKTTLCAKILTKKEKSSLHNQSINHSKHKLLATVFGSPGHSVCCQEK